MTMHRESLRARIYKRIHIYIYIYIHTHTHTHTHTHAESTCVPYVLECLRDIPQDRGSTELKVHPVKDTLPTQVKQVTVQKIIRSIHISYLTINNWWINVTCQFLIERSHRVIKSIENFNGKLLGRKYILLHFQIKIRGI